MLSNLRALLLKDFKTVFSNRSFLFLLIIPALLSFYMNYSEKTINAMKVKIAVLNHGSFQELETFKELNVNFDITPVDSDDEGREIVAQGKVVAFVTLPQNLTQSIAEKRTIQVSILLDELSSTSKIVPAQMDASLRVLGGEKPPVDFLIEKTKGHDPKQTSIPMLAIFASLIVGINILPMSLVIEKEKKTIDALLTCPTTPTQIILSKTIMGVVIGFFMMVIIITINNGLGNISIFSALVLLLTTLLFSVTGLLIGGIAKNQTSSGVIGSIVFIIMTFGVAAYSNGILTMKWLRFLPTVSAFEVLRKLMFYHTSFHDVLIPVSYLIVLLVVITGVSIMTVRSSFR